MDSQGWKRKPTRLFKKLAMFRFQHAELVNLAIHFDNTKEKEKLHTHVHHHRILQFGRQ